MDIGSILKRYEGFDIEKYRRLIHKTCLTLNMTYEEREQVVLKILTHKGSDFKASCKTCGKAFYLKNLEHTCNINDKLLFEYTSKPFVNKNDILSRKDDIRKRYPLEDKNIGAYVYRGMNFLTKEAYGLFINNIENGLLVADKVTSWTTEEKSSERFAYYIQKGTILSDEDRREMVVELLNSESKITGYKGIIIRTILKPEDVLADISNNDFGNFNEHEVVLLPGKYMIDIIKTIDKDGFIKINKITL